MELFQYFCIANNLFEKILALLQEQRHTKRKRHDQAAADQQLCHY